MSYKQKPIWWVLLLIATLSAGTGEVMAVEEPKYKITEQIEGIELRQYEPHIVAETFVVGDFSAVGNEGFRRLAGYIFGKNRKQQSIEMTAPVNQEISSETIAMTAPVNQEAQDGKWRITFTMPAEYTMDSLPVPLDERITLKQEPGRHVAAIRYSGSWSQALYEEKLAQLRSFLEQRTITAVGEPIFARYNSPFTLWFLRRNEVLIPVALPDN